MATASPPRSPVHSLTQFIYDAQSSTPSHFYYIFVFIILGTSLQSGNVCIIRVSFCVCVSIFQEHKIVAALLESHETIL